MKRVTITIDEEVDLTFRKIASQKFKFKAGWYSKSIEEAMKLWIELYTDSNDETEDK